MATTTAKATTKTRKPRTRKPATEKAAPKRQRRIGARYFTVKGVEIYQQLKTKKHSEIFPNPDQPRKLFEAEALKELAGSIKENNLLQPISITPQGMIIAGERRWRACELAELTEVACLETGCVDGSTVPDSIIMALAMLENLARKDMTPMEEALGYKFMLDEGYFGEDPKIAKKELAKFLGKDVFRINERLDLLELVPQAQQAFNDGSLTRQQAWYMARVETPEKQQKMLAMINSGKLGNDADKLKRAVAILNTPEVEQPGFGFDLEDPAIVTRWLKLQGQVKGAAQTVTALTTNPDQLEELTETRCEDLVSLLNGIMEAAILLKRQVSDVQLRHLVQ